VDAGRHSTRRRERDGGDDARLGGHHHRVHRWFGVDTISVDTDTHQIVATKVKLAGLPRRDRAEGGEPKRRSKDDARTDRAARRGRIEVGEPRIEESARHRV